MPEEDVQHLRVLIANERRDRLELLAKVVTGLGHDVIAREIYVKEVGPATAENILTSPSSASAKAQTKPSDSSPRSSAKGCAR